MVTEKQYDQAVEIINKYRKQLEERLKTIEYLGVLSKDELLISHLSSRALGAVYVYEFNRCKLKRDELDNYKISNLSEISIYKIRQYRNVGKKTLREIIELAKKANVTLKY